MCTIADIRKVVPHMEGSNRRQVVAFLKRHDKGKTTEQELAAIERVTMPLRRLHCPRK